MCNRKFTIAVCLAHLVIVQCAPRSTKASTNYDQKQTGEYNIQLHLKDFQIIALLGQDSLDSLAGDYDYDYDYSDFTIKPVTPSTTTTAKPDNGQQTSTPAAETKINTTSNPLTTINESKPEQAVLQPQTTEKTMELFELITLPPEKPSSSPQSPGQIPVIVQEFSLPTLTIIRKEPNDSKTVVKKEPNESATNVAIMPAEESLPEAVDSEHANLGEIVHYRRCPQGFGRDKRGRCRKIRRPQFPLGISRLASTLASRLRQPPVQRSDAVEDFSQT